MCENHFAAIFILVEGIHDRRIRKASVIGGMIRKNPSPDTFERYGTIMDLLTLQNCYVSDDPIAQQLFFFCLPDVRHTCCNVFLWAAFFSAYPSFLSTHNKKDAVTSLLRRTNGPGMYAARLLSGGSFALYERFACDQLILRCLLPNTSRAIPATSRSS